MTMISGSNYLKFKEGTPFPEVIDHNPHVTYKVDDLEKYIEDAYSVTCGLMIVNEKNRLAFVWIDSAILKLHEENENGKLNGRKSKRQGKASSGVSFWYPRPESNRQRCFRRALLYPFNYGDTYSCV